MNVRIISLLVLASASLSAAVIGCSGAGEGSDDDDSTPTPSATPTSTPTETPGTFANFAGVVSVAIRGSASATPQAFGPTLSCSEYLPTGELVGLDSAGNPTPLLSRPYQAAHLTLTSSNLVVRGNGIVQDIGTGDLFDCCILAIPRSSTVSSVRCLSEYTPESTEGGGFFDSRSGIVTSGDTVYFEAGNATDDVLRWDGVSDFTETVLHVAGLKTVHAATGASNLCATFQDPDYSAICGQPIVGSFSVIPFDSPTVQIGDAVWSLTESLDLKTLTKMSLPEPVHFGYTNTPAPLIRLQDGSQLALAQLPARTTVYVTRLAAPDIVEPIPTPTPPSNGPWWWEHMVGTQNWAVVSGYVYGTGEKDLRFIDLSTLTMSTANLLASVNLLQVEGMHFAGPTLLQIDGTGTNGLPATVFIDAATGEVTDAPPAESQYFQVLDVE